MTGVYYSSAGLQHPNYRELLIPDLYADMMDRVSALLAAGGPKSFLNPGFLFTMFSEWSGLIQVLELRNTEQSFLKTYKNKYLCYQWVNVLFSVTFTIFKEVFVSRNAFKFNSNR